jgi:hypothetical protein
MKNLPFRFIAGFCAFILGIASFYVVESFDQNYFDSQEIQNLQESFSRNFQMEQEYSLCEIAQNPFDYDNRRIKVRERNLRRYFLPSNDGNFFLQFDCGNNSELNMIYGRAKFSENFDRHWVEKESKRKTPRDLEIFFEGKIEIQFKNSSFSVSPYIYAENMDVKIK